MRNTSLLILTAVCGLAHATITIDDFGTGNVSQTINAGTSIGFQNGSMVGGDRYTLTGVQSNPFGLEIQTDIAGGSYSLSSQGQVNGFGEVGYGFAPNGSGTTNQNLNLNLSTENAFKFNFESSDAPGSLIVSVRSSSSNGGNYATVTKAIPGNQVNTPFHMTVGFNEFAGINFNDIDQMVVRFDTGASGDLTLTSFEAVPEPGTMIALGLGAVVAARKRRKA